MPGRKMEMKKSSFCSSRFLTSSDLKPYGQSHTHARARRRVAAASVLRRDSQKARDAHALDVLGRGARAGRPGPGRVVWVGQNR
mmetsp:Transcript_9628/g.31858  ORF Transcript_9628/g.31858 Transcript_9628/m.31858 type:complete len:84 (+) Transcript_9628:3050-3301(+)